MASTLSTWAQRFVREDRVAVLSALNKDGSPFVTTMWYLFQEDGTIAMNTVSSSQKAKNLQRDPRIALCVGDESRSVSLYGTVTIIKDRDVIRRDLEQLTTRYVKDEAARTSTLAFFLGQDRVSLHFKPAKVTEFSTTPQE